MKLHELNIVLKLSNHIMEKGSKLSFATANHNLKNYNKLLDKKGEFNDLIHKWKLRNCLVGDKKEVLFDDKNEFLFTLEKQIEFVEYQELLFEKDVEFDFFKVNFEDLTDTEKERFTAKQGDSYKIYGLDSEEYGLLTNIIDDLPEFE